MGRATRALAVSGIALALGGGGIAFSSLDGASGAPGPIPHGTVVMSFRVDARIAKGNGPYIGNNEVNENGAGQTVSVQFEPGKSKTIRLRVQNESGVQTDGVTLDQGCELLGSLRCTYTFKGKDVTNKVVNGNFDFKNAQLAPGDVTPTLKLRLKAKNNSEPGGGFMGLDFASAGNPDEEDSVGVSFSIS